MYRFFAQPQVNYKYNSIYGYEVLLRQKSADAWHLPKDFNEITIGKQTELVEDAVAALKTAVQHKVVAFNLNLEQVRNPLTLGAIIRLKKRINPSSLMVELTEAPTLAEVKEFSLFLHQYQIGLGLDDVGTGSNTFDNIEILLPYVDEIKLAMQNLREEGHAQEIPDYLAFWSHQAKLYQLSMVLEGIENPSDQQLAKVYGINIHQGYLYGKPALPDEHQAQATK